MAAETFAVAEVAEAILLNLPYEDIFAVQRVSRQFKQTIEGSPSLTRAVFLKYANDEVDETITLNPFLQTVVRRAGFELGAHTWDPDTNTLRITLHNHQARRYVEEKGLAEFGSWSASWRKTSVTSREVAVKLEYSQYGYHDYSQNKVYDLDGWTPTLGQLFDTSFLVRGHYERWAELIKR